MPRRMAARGQQRPVAPGPSEPSTRLGAAARRGVCSVQIREAREFGSLKFRKKPEKPTTPVRRERTRRHEARRAAARGPADALPAGSGRRQAGPQETSGGPPGPRGSPAGFAWFGFAWKRGSRERCGPGWEFGLTRPARGVGWHGVGRTERSSGGALRTSAVRVHSSSAPPWTHRGPSLDVHN